MPARYLVASLLVFVLCAGFGVLFHGVLLEDRYVENAELLRGAEELFPRLPYMIAAYLVQALLFCHVFTKGYEARGLAEGARTRSTVAHTSDPDTGCPSCQIRSSRRTKLTEPLVSRSTAAA